MTAEPDRSSAAHKSRVALTVLLAVSGAAIGFFGFGLVAFGWILGPVALLIGLVGRRTGAPWAYWALWAGVGLTLGALSYVLLGLLQPDGPSSGGGSGGPG